MPVVTIRQLRIAHAVPKPRKLSFQTYVLHLFPISVQYSNFFIIECSLKHQCFFSFFFLFLSFKSAYIEGGVCVRIKVYHFLTSEQQETAFLRVTVRLGRGVQPLRPHVRKLVSGKKNLSQQVTGFYFCQRLRQLPKITVIQPYQSAHMLAGGRPMAGQPSYTTIRFTY